MTDKPDAAAVMSPATKAGVLSEALPYIRRFHGKTIRPAQRPLWRPDPAHLGWHARDGLQEAVGVPPQAPLRRPRRSPLPRSGH